MPFDPQEYIQSLKNPQSPAQAALPGVPVPQGPAPAAPVYVPPPPPPVQSYGVPPPPVAQARPAREPASALLFAHTSKKTGKPFHTFTITDDGYKWLMAQGWTPPANFVKIGGFVNFAQTAAAGKPMGYISFKTDTYTKGA